MNCYKCGEAVTPSSSERLQGLTYCKRCFSEKLGNKEPSRPDASTVGASSPLQGRRALRGEEVAAFLTFGAWLTLVLGLVGSWWIGKGVSVPLAIAALLQTILWCALLLGVATVIENQLASQPPVGRAAPRDPSPDTPRAPLSPTDY